ncbi:hypothetical protein EGH90_10585 [Kaistella haifensis]|nr:hypothetical protein EGH90_10585 [Kaistella haifensis]
MSLVLRVVFIFHPITNADFGIFESLKIILLGLLSDIFVFVLSSSLLALYFLWQNWVNDWVSVY